MFGTFQKTDRKSHSVLAGLANGCKKKSSCKTLEEDAKTMSRARDSLEADEKRKQSSDQEV